MKTDLLTDRHNGIQEADLPIMLEKIGVSSVDELIDKTIPANIRLAQPLALDAPMTERQFAEHIADLASQNKLYTSYIGMGWYDTICPAVIQRNVFENQRGTPRILRIRPKYRKDAWKHCLTSRLQ